MVRAPARLTGVVEWMDGPGVEPAELVRTLQDLAWINRRFGGTRVVVAHLAAVLDGLPPPVHLLDVGTGYADLPRAIVRWARRRRLALRMDAIDHDEAIREWATQACADYPEIHLRLGDARALPYPDRSVDIAIASQLLHHMEGEDPIRLLRELRRVARHGVIVGDLRRGVWPFLVTWATLHLVSRSPLIRHDGPLSIRRGFLPRELLTMAESAGWRAPQVVQHAFFRLALTERVA